MTGLLVWIRCTNSLGSPVMPLDGSFARFVGSNADGVFDRVDENFTVADFPGLRRIDHSGDRVFNQALNENYFYFDFGHKVNGVLTAAIILRVAFLPTKPFDLGDRHSL